MASTDGSAASPAETPGVGTVDIKLEVVTVAVSDVDRAKRFYQGHGWRLDADIVRREDFRVVQLTPPRSPCSVASGKALTRTAGIGSCACCWSSAPSTRARDLAQGVSQRAVPLFAFHSLRRRRYPLGGFSAMRLVERPADTESQLQEINDPAARQGVRIHRDRETSPSGQSYSNHTHEHHDPYATPDAPHNCGRGAPPTATHGSGATPHERAQAAGRYMEEVLHIAAL